MVRSAGVEPTLSAPEANVLSTGLRAHILNHRHTRIHPFHQRLKQYNTISPLWQELVIPIAYLAIFPFNSRVIKKIPAAITTMVAPAAILK